MMTKQTHFEINDSGSWSVACRFDEAGDEFADAMLAIVLNAAKEMAMALTWRTEHPRPLTLRMSIREETVLMHWTPGDGWRDAVTGEPA